MVKCCFTSTDTIRTIGDGHLLSCEGLSYRSEREAVPVNRSKLNAEATTRLSDLTSWSEISLPCRCISCNDSMAVSSRLVSNWIFVLSTAQGHLKTKYDSKILKCVCVCGVCVCVCVCVCMCVCILHIVMLEPLLLLTLCFSFC